MSSVRLREVGFSYQWDALDGGDNHVVTALAGLDLDFAPGTATLITGASGSGKSTALRLMNGLVPHLTGGELTGEVEVAGRLTRDARLDEIGRVTGTVFQNPRTQFLTATTLDELAFGMENAGLEAAEMAERIRDAASRAGISQLLGRPLADMSGGELQRVACGCALAQGAQILLLDEPTSNLSPAAIDELAALLVQLKLEGVTLVIAEHRLYFLDGVVDTVVRIEAGSTAEVSAAEDFFAMADDERRSLGLRSLGRPKAERTPADSRVWSGLRMRGLRYSYKRGTPVLAIDDLTFPAGRVTALCGPNGAGKSTLARVLTGLATQDDGTITLDGLQLSSKRRLTASSLVMQDVHRQLFAQTVTAEITLGLRDPSGVDVAGLLRDLDLEDLAERHPMSLSGGQKQRLVLAASLASRSRICVFDEPTSGVDYRHLCSVARRIREVAATGAVVIVISHDPEFVAACADLIVELGPIREATRNEVSTWEVLRPEESLTTGAEELAHGSRAEERCELRNC